MRNHGTSDRIRKAAEQIIFDRVSSARGSTGDGRVALVEWLKAAAPRNLASGAQYWLSSGGSTKESFHGATLNFHESESQAPGTFAKKGRDNSAEQERTPNGTLKLQQCAIRRPTQARHLRKLTGAASMDCANVCLRTGL